MTFLGTCYQGLRYIGSVKTYEGTIGGRAQITTIVGADRK